MKRLNAKAWLEKDGKFLVSEGRAQILELIEKTHSLSKTASEMKMSYRHLWGIIKEMESASKEKLVDSERGGIGGGKTELTGAGKRLLEEYNRGMKNLNAFLNNRGFLKPSLTVDGIIIHENKLVLIKRANPPFKGKYALPGGFVEYNEKVEEAAVREIKEETGFITEIKGIVGVYSDPNRDPRGHTVSVVFELNVKGGKMKSGSDAKEAKLFSLDKIPSLAFDHDVIVKDFLKRV
ncbi:MAG: NUDIX domain-containing protein [Thermoplasmata archaeon]|nr:MAG: NUDIX domain-containing protein [Thermoplasmata archaeon]